MTWQSVLPKDVPVLVTGAAGFIGYHVALRLLETGIPVVGLDSMSPYYAVALKRARLRSLTRHPAFAFVEADLADHAAVRPRLAAYGFAHVVHLAAQAGVRYSLENPFAYADANLTGFLTVLETCRVRPPVHLVYASSSSVYGGNTRLPFSTRDSADHPVSLYAATKKANELMAHSYAHLYGVPATGLRFFTVYGPWGRPDMAYWKFAEAILAGQPIDVYNHGDVSRDFTYIDDIVEGVLRVLASPPVADPGFDRTVPDPARSWAPHRIFNIGADRPEPVPALIAALETALGRKAVLRMLPMQPGDVAHTKADVTDLEAVTGFRPATPLADGIARFVAWFRWWQDSGEQASA